MHRRSRLPRRHNPLLLTPRQMPQRTSLLHSCAGRDASSRHRLHDHDRRLCAHKSRGVRDVDRGRDHDASGRHACVDESAGCGEHEHRSGDDADGCGGGGEAVVRRSGGTWGGGCGGGDVVAEVRMRTGEVLKWCSWVGLWVLSDRCDWIGWGVREFRAGVWSTGLY
jgi:hypothetical protein